MKRKYIKAIKVEAKKPNLTKKERVSMTQTTYKKQVNFTDYAPIRSDYTEKELSAIWERIILDVDGNRKRGKKR